MSAYVFRPPQDKAVPIVVSIPHTGVELAPDTAAAFADPATTALPMTDWHLHHLYDFLPTLGVTTLHARYSRYVIDLNRAPDGAALYPGRFETGLVPLETFDGEPIFREPPDAGAIEGLRRLYHAPYHQRLAAVLDAFEAEQGTVVLIDAHSVASRANRIHPALDHDIYLGNRDGESCDAWLIDTVGEVFADHGYRVRCNDPYKGGFITQHYGKRPGVAALQIEMCQRLYMNEDDPAVATPANFEQMQNCLVTLFATLAAVLERN
ncbi:MAG: N-formylglutamate amidohydrolase [Gammaproteobacteria bacterium]|nr:N-formylglutamate amidohydrolase [Gammaproteobacteria bacterium]